MKRKFPLLIMAALIGIFAMCSFSSCNLTKLRGCKTSTEQAQVVDSIVDAHIQDVINPVFSSVDDVMTYMDITADIKMIDSVFTSMPKEVIIKVTNVLLNRGDVASKKSIVLEYIAHPDIYPFLGSDTKTPDTSPTASTETKEPVASIQLVNEGKTTVTEAPPTRVEEKSGNYKDTVIDGKPAIIKQ